MIILPTSVAGKPDALYPMTQSKTAFLKNLRCPITQKPLVPVFKQEFEKFNIPNDFEGFGSIDSGFMDATQTWFYPVFNEIIILYKQYALNISKKGNDDRTLSFDKKRVFDYYNAISYSVKDSLKLYEDSPKWVDYREVSSKYMRNSFTRAAKFYPPEGKYLLDIASGPIGLPEYMSLCDGYDNRICIDISVNALLQARANLMKAGKKGIYICGDITNIPLADNCCDTVLSQHTLYHVPKNDQHKAVTELYRVAAKGARIVIIYSWFYRSSFMNLSLNVVQLYRIARHFAGKWYVKLAKSRPRLYFYPHSRRWFRRSFSFGEDIEFYSWRSTNKYFMDIFIHRRLWGEKILDRLRRLEDKHSKFLGRHGEYPAIVITKKE